jgi:hypothetical protein
MVRRVARAFAVIAIGFVVGACSPSAFASASPIASGPLVTVTMNGGLCPAGMCESVIVIERDGRVHRLKPVIEELGIVPTNTLAALDTAVRTTNFEAVRARPFTGQCPTAHDSQEVVYEFGASGGVQRIASCETAFDPDSALFAAVSAALQATSIPMYLGVEVRRPEDRVELEILGALQEEIDRRG